MGPGAGGDPAAHGQWRARAGRARAQHTASRRVGGVPGHGAGPGGCECRARPRAVAARLRMDVARLGAAAGVGGLAARGPPLRCPRRALGHQRFGAARRAGWGTRPSLWRRRAADSHCGRPPRGVPAPPVNSARASQAAQVVRWRGRAAEQAGRDARPPAAARLVSPRRRGQLREATAPARPAVGGAARVSSVPLARGQRCARPAGAWYKALCCAARQRIVRRRRRTLLLSTPHSLLVVWPLLIHSKHRATEPRRWAWPRRPGPALSGERTVAVARRTVAVARRTVAVARRGGGVVGCPLRRGSLRGGRSPGCSCYYILTGRRTVQLPAVRPLSRRGGNAEAGVHGRASVGRRARACGGIRGGGVCAARRQRAAAARSYCRSSARDGTWDFMLMYAHRAAGCTAAVPVCRVATNAPARWRPARSARQRGRAGVLGPSGGALLSTSITLEHGVAGILFILVLVLLVYLYYTSTSKQLVTLFQY